MTDEAVEAVARAMEPSLFQHDDYVVGPATRYARDEARRKARLAITAYEANRTDVEELRKEAAFLCERMRDFSWTVDANDAEDIYREFHGHVMPSLARMDEALTRISSLGKKGS